MYLLNSHVSRDFPMPATPSTETRCTFPWSAESWNSSLVIRSSRSRPVKCGSRAVDLLVALRRPTTREARQRSTGASFPFSSKEPAGS
jgi:hypothetical protein